MRCLLAVVVALVLTGIGMPAGSRTGSDAPDSSASDHDPAPVPIDTATTDDPSETDEEIPFTMDPEEIFAFIRIVPGAKTFKGKGTDARFPHRIVIEGSGEDVVLSALGSGVRKKFLFKVYEGVAYAEAEADLGSDPYSTLIEGDFAKGIHMFFERDVEGKKIRDAYRDGVKKILGRGPWDPTLAQDFETFLGFFDDEGLKDGQTIDLVWLPGKGLHTVVVGEPFPPVNNRDLASALWAIWFGEDPVSGDLKKDMIRFLTKGRD
jgi:hypothetical protein